MKIEDLYIGLMFTSASILTGCGEYEDTETTSPQADANAIGANFASEMQNAQVTPDSISFDMAMNRVNPEGAKVIKVNTLKNTNTFCTPPTEFNFEDGKMATKKTVMYDISKCTFQKPDTLTIKIDADAKDHIYGDGYLQTSIAFVVDYTWKDSIKTTAIDEYISSDKAPFPVTVQIATDYDKKKNKTTTLVRLPDYFKNAGKTTKDGAANIQFAVNNSDRKNPQLIWNISNNDFGGLKFNKDKIETGISHIVEGTGDEEDKTYDVYMKGLSISENTSSDASTTAEAEEETIDVTYKLEYELYYKDDEGVEHNIDETTTKYSSEFTIKFPKTSDSITSTEE